MYYGEFQALFNVSLRVSEGETVITVGPNGAGKSSLLKTISGLLQARSGTVTFLGKPIEHLPAHEIVELGITPRSRGEQLFPQLSVYENLKVGSYLKRARSEAAATLKDIYRLFPILDERKKQLADTMSGGERQMLAIARCLMSRPRLILLDEPSSGLAPRVVTRVLEFVHQIKAQGYAILMVEQNVRILARAAESDPMEHRDVVADDRGLPNHDPRTVVDEDARADARGRMDVYVEDHGDPVLEVEGEGMPALLPKPMGDSMGLEGVEALEMEEGLGEAPRGRIALHHGGEILPDRRAYRAEPAKASSRTSRVDMAER